MALVNASGSGGLSIKKRCQPSGEAKRVATLSPRKEWWGNIEKGKPF